MSKKIISLMIVFGVLLISFSFVALSKEDLNAGFINNYEKIEVKGVSQEISDAQQNEIVKKAKVAGMKTEGLTAGQIVANTTKNDFLNSMKNGEEEKSVVTEMAQKFGILTEGRSYKEIKGKVYEKMLPELVERAKKYGVDSTGQSYEQLLQKVKNKEIEKLIKNKKK